MIADQDTEWWPFSSLRPEPEQLLTPWRVLLLAVLHAVPITLLLSVVARLDRASVDLVPFCFFATLGVFAVLSLTLGVPWNRRARKLSDERSRVSARRREGP